MKNNVNSEVHDNYVEAENHKSDLNEVPASDSIREMMFLMAMKHLVMATPEWKDD